MITIDKYKKNLLQCSDTQCLKIILYSNDFDESWYEVKRKPGFHYFTKKMGILV